MAPLQATEFAPLVAGSFAGIPLNGGRTQAVSVHPSNPDEVVIATQFGGLWRTVDGGARWRHLHALQTVLASDVQYGEGGRSLVATLQQDSHRDNGAGIYVSRSSGWSWERPPTGVIPTGSRFPTRPSAWGIDYAPDRGGTWYVGTDAGIAVSHDDAVTWRHVDVRAGARPFADRMQSSVRSVLAFPAGRVLAMVRNAVLRSDDYGENWRAVRSGAFDFHEWCGWNKMARSPNSKAAFILVDYEHVLVYELDTEAWAEIPLPIGGSSRGPFIRAARSSGGGTKLPIVQTTLWVGQGTRVAYATRPDVDSLKSLGEGDWALLGRGQGIHDDMGDMGLDGHWRPRMIGSDGGVFRPTGRSAVGDFGEWESAAPAGSGMNSFQITDLAGTNIVDGRRSSTTLYFATQDNAIWSSTDGGVTWPAYDCAEGFHTEVEPHAGPDEVVTVAYGKVGCGPGPNMFSDPGLINQRAVPSVDVDGNNLEGWFQAFYISPQTWIRLRMPPDGGASEIYVSTDDGDTWRRRFTTTLAIRGTFQRSQVALAPRPPRAWLPVEVPGSTRVGLVRLTALTDHRVDALAADRVIELPDGGSLGTRATEFDWQAVVGVDPYDHRFLVAPDIVAGDVKISRNGGQSWSTDTTLTDLVTDSGALLMYIDPYRMQVTHISFDTYNARRIFVGTRDSGIIYSEDKGATWLRISGSEAVRYCTGFFFLPDSTVVASTYGRGLWRVREGLGCMPGSRIVYKLSNAVVRAIRAVTRSAGPRSPLRPTTEPEGVEDGQEPLSVRRDSGPTLLVSTNWPSMGLPVTIAGGPITLSAFGFAPSGGAVQVTLDDSRVEDIYEVDEQGASVMKFAVPADWNPGIHILRAEQQDSGIVATVQLVIANDDDHLGNAEYEEPRTDGPENE